MVKTCVELSTVKAASRSELEGFNDLVSVAWQKLGVTAKLSSRAYVCVA